MSDRVITEIWWEPSQGFDVRGETTLSDPDKIRLDPGDHQLKLKVQPDTFRYPTDADLYVRSKVYEPGHLSRLLMVQLNAEIPDGTVVNLRLHDGTDDYYWDGGAWAVAGAGDWNTEDEVNANVSTFDVLTARKFAVVFNLETADDAVTPVVESLFVLWESDREIDWAEDLLVESLLGILQDELTIPSDFALPPLPAASASIDLTPYRTDGALDIRGVTEVYDYTADPERKVNLFSAYDTGTKVLTLTAAIPLGNVPLIRLKLGVNAAWDTSRDFTELGRLPEVILRDTSSMTSSPYPSRAAQGIVRKDTNAAVEIPAPQRMTYEIEMELRTDRTMEQMRLHTALVRFLTVGPSSEIGPFLRSKATDRRYRIHLVDEMRSAAFDPKEAGDVRVTRGTFRIRDAAFNLAPAVDTFGVKTLKMNFSRVDSVARAKAIEDGAPIPTTTPEEIQVT